jgi:hypothetical protein
VPDLSYEILGSEAVPYSAAPMLAFKLKVSQPGAIVPIHAIALRCQIRIEPARRKYSDAEAAKLEDLFDTRDRWGQTLKSLLWTHANVTVGPFASSALVDLPVPCTYDFNVAATKYFHAVEDGEITLTLLFSGTVFHETDDANLQVEQIPWSKDAVYRLPVRVWKEMMEHYYPNSAWLCLRRDAYDRLAAYKSRRKFTSFEQTVEHLLPMGGE